jgi:hypothetical protein
MGILRGYSPNDLGAPKRPAVRPLASPMTGAHERGASIILSAELRFFECEERQVSGTIEPVTE